MSVDNVSGLLVHPREGLETDEISTGPLSETLPEGSQDALRLLWKKQKELESQFQSFQKRYEVVAQTQVRQAMMNLPTNFEIRLKGGKKKILALRYPSIGKVEYVMSLLSSVLEVFWTEELGKSAENDFRLFLTLLWTRYESFRPKFYEALQYLFDPSDCPDVSDLAVTEMEVRSLDIAAVVAALTEKFTPFVATILPFLGLKMRPKELGGNGANGNLL